MIISGVVIETLPGRADSVCAYLAGVDGVEIAGTDGNSRIAAVWRRKDGTQLESEAERLLQSQNEILGIFPAFVGSE